MSKLRIQQYMDKHRLTPLFEDLMNKVLHEQPEDPVIYLIKCLYRKAALPVPKDLKVNQLRRSSPERPGRRSKSPEKSSTQAWAVGSGPDMVDRSYDKPWLAKSKKSRSKGEEEKTEPKPSRKQKSGWVSDTKVTATTFDELFEDDIHQRSENNAQRNRTEDNLEIKKAWAKNVSLDDSEDPNYRSRGYSGPRGGKNNEDPLSGEIMLAKEEQTQESTSNSSKSKPRGAKLEAAKHRQELEKILTESDKVSVDSGYYGDKNNDEEDEAIELLEDPDDLMREGVTNIPKSGYKLSKVLRHRREEANVKLNINMEVSERKRGTYGDYYESDVERPPTGMSMQSNKFSEFSPDISDDEFESVSQVVGPRQPVWKVPDSDGEPTKAESSKRKPQARFSATAPLRSADRLQPQASVDSENIFLDGNKTWTAGQTSQDKSGSINNLRESARSFRSQDGKGWNIPDDTEVSVTSRWSETPTSARQSPGPPKAY
ncbi:hypothetical protein ACF0H5_022832 [Mactra antiquata]